MNENEVSQGDEISFFDLWEKLRRGWVTVVGGVVLGIVGAVLAIFLIPPKYEAVALIQVGRVGQVGQAKVSGMPVEAPVQTIERMKTPSFQRRVAEALNDQAWLEAISRSSSGVAKDLSMQIVRGTVGPEQVPLIELRADGTSPEAARGKVAAVVAQLTKAHAELAQPALVRMRTDLAISREKLASAERDLDALTKLVAAAGVKDDRFTQLALMTSLRIQKEAETFSQRQTITALEMALGAPATQSAGAVEAIFVPEKPIAPKMALLLIFGIVGGLFAGVMWLFATYNLQRAQGLRKR
ncbi:MAG: hypothetical protein HYU78_11485 [Rhodocyclales bacterium]|nr:hypothetical protein [Rhodocyclales bacterium]